MANQGTPAELVSPACWIDRLGSAGLLWPGTVVVSGTITMIEGVDQFAEG